MLLGRFSCAGLTNISVCALWASSDGRCRFLERFFLGLSIVCPVFAQAVWGWLPLGDQDRHRYLNYLRQYMMPGLISRIFALLVSTSLRIASCYPQ